MIAPDDMCVDKAMPFLKWAGGKRQLVPTIRGIMPKKYGRYHEPFIGGGALFFDVAPDAAQHGPAYLADANEELLTTYVGVKHHVRYVIGALEVHKLQHATRGKEYYLEQRAMDPSKMHCSAIAARMIYINKTCFNGVYRVNKNGKYNVPMGSYANPTILDPIGLRACSLILKRANADLVHGDFSRVRRIAQKGDFVYFDPPYVEVSKTAKFKSYTSVGFGEDQQRKLAQLFADLTNDGVYCIASNSDTPLVRELYAGFPALEVSRSGSINSDVTKRERVGELLIRGWEW